MCGRYASSTPPDELARHFGATQVTKAAATATPRFNVAPTTSVLAVATMNDHRTLGTMRWGFVPRWAKTLSGRGQPINARLETVAESRMFASSWRQRRCLLPADAYYEWKDPGGGARKQPYAIADPDGSPMAFAGIWRVWQPPPADPGAETPGASVAEPVTSMAILTTAARGEAAAIHDRMPVILPSRLWETWLDTDEEAAPFLLSTLEALTAPRLIATPVSTRVNNVRNDGPDLLDPLPS